MSVVLFNHGKEIFYIDIGDKIAQIVCEMFLRPEIEVIQFYDVETVRGTNGFGSTN